MLRPRLRRRKARTALVNIGPNRGKFRVQKWRRSSRPSLLRCFRRFLLFRPCPAILCCNYTNTKIMHAEQTKSLYLKQLLINAAKWNFVLYIRIALLKLEHNFSLNGSICHLLPRWSYCSSTCFQLHNVCIIMIIMTLLRWWILWRMKWK